MRKGTMRFSDFADEEKKRYTLDEKRIIMRRIASFEQMFNNKNTNGNTKKGIDK